MYKWLHKILFIAITFSFFISATEMSFGEVHNTFFDDYDTYVKTEQVTVDHVDVQQQQKGLLELVCFFFNQYNSYCNKVYLNKNSCFAAKYSPPKLFLRNAVWRI